MKKKNRNIYIIILVLGLVNLIIATLDIIAGNPFGDYFLTLFIGVTLTGVAYLQLRAKSDNNDNNELP